MRYFRNILFALAAFLWLPASAHCQLETLSCLDFLKCSTVSTAAHDSCPDADSGCCTVEKSSYHAKSLRVTLSLPDLLPLTFANVAIPAASLPAEVSGGILTAAPPQWLSTRQFVCRTALPARAPSLAS